MTAPRPSPTPQAPPPAPSTAAPSVPINPDGTPDLTPAQPSQSAGRATIWNTGNIYKELSTGGAGTMFWFDVGHTPDQSDLSPKTVKRAAPTSYQILRTPDQVMAQFMAMSWRDPAKFFALQKTLASGAWGAVNPTGQFDTQTQNALLKAMQQYVQLSIGTGTAVSFSDYLVKTGQRAQALGGKGTSLGAQTSGAGPSVIAVTDPDQIRQAAQQAAQDALGQGLSDDQINKFVAQFQAAQSAAQTATSGQVSTPDLSASAQQFAQQQDPGQYHQNQRQAFMSALVNMFAPAESQRPNQTPVPAA